MAAYIPPRDAYEFQIAMSASPLLGGADVGARDDLAALGMDADRIGALATRLRPRLGRELPAAGFQGTVESIAGRYRQRERCNRWSSVVPVQVGRERLPLVLVHPIGGNGFWYLPLCRRLSPELTIYALQSRALDLSEPLPPSVPDLARIYLDDMRADGVPLPCALAGWSFGGVVAFEMARQLREAGVEVPLLAMFDTGTGDARTVTATSEAAFYLLIHAVRVDRLAGEIMSLPREERFEAILGPAIARHMAPPSFRPAEIERMLAINEAHLESSYGYDFGHYPGDLLVFRSEGRPEPAGPGEDLLGWEEVIEGEISVQALPGNHFDALGRRNLPIIADRLNTDLTKAASSLA